MKKAIFPLLILFLFTQCGPKSTTETQEEQIPDGMAWVRIKDVNTDFLFPKRLRKRSIHELAILSKDSSLAEDDRKYCEIAILLLQQDEKAEILIDEEDLFDQVFFRKVKFVELSKRASSLLLGQMKTALEQGFGMYGATIETVDNKMIRSSTTQILKGKFKIDMNGIERYWTQYYISVDMRGVSVLVFNETGEDYEESIKNMRVY